MQTYVAYYRVSTQKQGQSGLGLEAQKKMVEEFCKGGQVLTKFTDIQSWKNNNWQELLKAISNAKAKGACLLIAKLDRLSRNVFFISSILESGVQFKALTYTLPIILLCTCLRRLQKKKARWFPSELNCPFCKKRKKLQVGQLLSYSNRRDKKEGHN